MKCWATRTKTGKERCKHTSLPGLQLCRKHITSSRRWVTVNNLVPLIIKIQRNWRKFLVYNRIKLAGACVLNRAQCHNEEEMITLAHKNTVSPLDFFSFEESNKIFWFDIRSLARYWSSKLEITNPYTRQIVPHTTRRRFRKLCRLNRVRINNNKWIQICQILEEIGINNVNPVLIQHMNRTQMFMFMRLIYDDWRASRIYDKYLVWIQQMFLMFDFRQLSQEQYSDVVSDTLLGIMIDCKEPIFIGYTIIGAIQRM